MEKPYPIETDEKQVALTNWQRYRRARDNGHDAFVRKARKCDEFYQGKQWDDADKAALDAMGRPALTINMVLSTINAVLGEQADRRADIRYKPRRGASEETAADLNRIYKHVTSTNNFDEKEAQVFSDGTIQGRGFYDIRMDYADNVMGDVEITAEDPTDVVIDPDAKEADPKTWSEVFINRWMSVDDIELQYGKEAADKLRLLSENDGWNMGEDSFEFEEYNRFGDTDRGELSQSAARNPRLKRVRVIERQYYKLDNAIQFVDLENGDSRIAPHGFTMEKAKAFAAQYEGLFVKKQVINRVRWTVTADHCVLHDDWSPYRTFTIVPYFPYFRRGKPFGIMENLLDPQMFLNKLSSQELHIVNTTANSGWIVEDGSLSDVDEDDLEETGARTGIVLKYKRGYTPPEKIQPNQIPTGVDRLSQKASMAIKEISGINDSMLGSDRPDVAGIAMKQNISRGQVQLKVPLENLRKSRRLVAEKILELVQDFYTETRLIYITEENEPEENQVEHEVNQVGPNDTILNDVTKGKYDVVVSTMPARDSYDEVQFAEALQLREIGVQVPDHFIVEYSHLERKRELARLLKDMQGFGELTPEQQQQQQQEQQLQMQMAEAQLMELRGKAASLEAQALLSNAKAEELEGANKVDEQLRGIQSQIELKELELRRRMQMSTLGHMNAQGQSRQSNQTKMAIEAMKLQTQQQQREQPNAPAKDRQ